jgi:hypothetical protein
MDPKIVLILPYSQKPIPVQAFQRNPLGDLNLTGDPTLTDNDRY